MISSKQFHVSVIVSVRWLPDNISMGTFIQVIFPRLSDDPDKNCSIFYCSAAIRFPRVETVECAEEEFINQWKAGL